MKFRFAVVLTAGVLSACGAGTGRGVSPPILAPIHSNNGASVQFVMHWPAAHGSQARRRPLFISPSTLSISVEVNNDPAKTTIVNNPSTSGQATTSTISFPAPPGNDAITFALWDQPNATGNEVGQGSVTQTINAGQPNTISATIDGIASYLTFSPVGNQPQVQATTDPTGNVSYTITGDVAPALFAATALDADKNVIIASGNTVVYSAASADASLTVAPVAGQPNQFTVRPARPVSNGHPGVLVTARDGSGTLVTANAPMTLNTLMYVAYENSGTGSIAAFDSQGNQVPLAGSFPGVVDPRSIVYDYGTHRIFVADHGANALLAFNPDGTAVQGFPAVSVPGATALTYDTHNAQLYVVTDSNKGFAFTTNGAPITLPGTFAFLSNPTGIAYYDPLRTLYVANNTGKTLSVYNEDGTSGNFPIPVPRAVVSTSPFLPFGIAASSDLLMATEANGTSYALKSIAIGSGAASLSVTTGLANPAGVFIDAADNVYVVNKSSGAVTVYPSPIALPSITYAAPSAFSAPTSVTVAY